MSYTMLMFFLLVPCKLKLILNPQNFVICLNLPRCYKHDYAKVTTLLLNRKKEKRKRKEKTDHT